MCYSYIIIRICVYYMIYIARPICRKAARAMADYNIILFGLCYNKRRKCVILTLLLEFAFII